MERLIYEAAALAALAAISGTLLAAAQGASPFVSAIIGTSFGFACVAIRLSSRRERAYAGEDDDTGGTKPSDPDDGTGDDE